MKDEIIKDIGRNIVWLDKNAKSDNILIISQVINKLQIQAATLANDVTKLYALMNNNEDIYKEALAKFVTNYDGSIAKAERAAEAEYAHLKKEWTEAKNLYKRFDVILDRIDKICDSYRQRISVVKQAELKNV